MSARPTSEVNVTATVQVSTRVTCAGDSLGESIEFSTSDGENIYVTLKGPCTNYNVTSHDTELSITLKWRQLEEMYMALREAARRVQLGRATAAELQKKIQPIDPEEE